MALYKRFRVTDHDGPAVFAADLLGCSWSCAGCYSRFGGRGEPAALVLTGDEAAARLTTGLARHHLTTARLGYGEPGEQWEHTLDVATGFLRRTHTPQRLVIETNGADLTPARIDALDAQCGAGACRIILDVGVKATSADQLAALTGREDVEAVHLAQLHAVLHTAWVSDRLGLRVTFLDAFSDPAIVAAIAHELERAREGLSAGVRVMDYNPIRDPGRPS